MSLELTGVTYLTRSRCQWNAVFPRGKGERWKADGPEKATASTPVAFLSLYRETLNMKSL